VSRIQRSCAQIAAAILRCSSSGVDRHAGCQVKSSTQCQGTPVRSLTAAANVDFPLPVAP
jgi:hypothetical protein